MGILNILLTVVGAFVFGFMAMYYSGQSVNAVSITTSTYSQSHFFTISTSISVTPKLFLVLVL